MIKVNEKEFEKEVINETKPVLIDFNADWCGPCRMLGPVLEELSKENDKIKVVSVNVDDEVSLAEKYGVSSIPCLILIKDGKEIKRNVGLLPKSELERFIEE